MPDMISLGTSDIAEVLVDITGQLWKFVTDLDCPIANPAIPAAMCTRLKDGFPTLEHKIIFALANFAAISLDARNFLLELDFASDLCITLASHTRTDAVRTGLRLVQNLISYSVEDIDILVVELIPILRCYMRHICERNRWQAVRCLNQIMEHAPAIEACIDQEVDRHICEYIQSGIGYIPELFECCKSIFEWGHIEPFLSSEFLDAIVRLLQTDLQYSLGHVFGLIMAMMQQIWNCPVIGDIMEAVMGHLHQGSYEDRVEAANCVFCYLDFAVFQVRQAVGSQEFFDDIADMLEDLDEEMLPYFLGYLGKFFVGGDSGLCANGRGSALGDVLAGLQADDEKSAELLKQLQDMLAPADV
jgi:hypothetical protein